MPTLVTPSAKAHERVTGRWIRDIEVQTKSEWLVYYLKVIFGSPIPWLLWSYAILALVSRAGLEVAAWVCATLTWLYVIVDRFTRTKEFTFFRIGSDFFLLGYFLCGLIAALGMDAEAGMATIGGMRWVILLYAIAYCFELFPGLNRVFYLTMLAACAASGYGIWQHFTGMDPVRGEELANSPATTQIYFVARSFFSTPEIFGTLMAMCLPFPVSAFLLVEEKGSWLQRWFYAAISFLLMVGIVWTYQPGLWIAALVGVAVALLMQGRQVFTYMIATVVFLTGLFFISYNSPEDVLSNVQTAEIIRAEKQRAQINSQVSLWQEGPWVGVGSRALGESHYDPGTGNVYFQVLAQSGVLGGAFYLLFILSFLLTTYRIYREIPRSHFWHRVLTAGGLAGQIAFHVSGLYWATLNESLVVYLFVLIIAAIAYTVEHYNRGLVPDDTSL